MMNMLAKKTASYVQACRQLFTFKDLQRIHRLARSLISIADRRDSGAITTPNSVQAVRLVLLQRLPAELVTLILELAQYWICSVTARQEQTPKRFSNANFRYLRTEPLNSGDLMRPLRRVTITTISKDQGWSGEPENHGTYTASWTWFELTLDSPSGEEKYRTEIVRNVHAGESFLKHVRDVNDPELFALAEKGDTLSVWVRAKYPGWANHVDSVEIKTYVAE